MKVDEVRERRSAIGRGQISVLVINPWGKKRGWEDSLKMYRYTENIICGLDRIIAGYDSINSGDFFTSWVNAGFSRSAFHRVTRSSLVQFLSCSKSPSVVWIVSDQQNAVRASDFLKGSQDMSLHHHVWKQYPYTQPRNPLKYSGCYVYHLL
jgi:hypothetical protein